jgi:putative membrane protein insertion efficiency factor
MSAAPRLVPEPSRPPDAGAPVRERRAVPPVGATAVFHVERLPLGGWVLESSPGPRRAGAIDRLAGDPAGGPARPAAAASLIGALPVLSPARAAARRESAASGLEVRRARNGAGVPGSGYPHPSCALRQSGVGIGRVWRRVFALPFLALLWIYRKLVSPVLPPACRYYPSCSQYAVEAVTLHGPLRGVWLSARRLLRCHPWAPGGPDPVPPPGAPI